MTKLFLHDSSKNPSIMKFKVLFFAILLSLISIFGHAQSKALAKADKKASDLAYIDAISIYEKVANKGYKAQAMFKRLGNCYYFNAEYIKANKWYESLFAMDEEVEPDYYFRYSQTLKSVGENDKADEMLKIYVQKSGNDNRAKILASNLTYRQKIKVNSGRYNIKDAGVNSAYSDYGTSFYGDQLVFTSAREDVGAANIKMKLTDQYFSNLYGATANGDGSMGTPQKFSKILNTKFNESTAVFTKDGKTMYFTRNNYTAGKRRSNEQKVTLLKLYRAKWDGERWADIEELPFNSDNYSTAHPALSPDDKILYFASDMPGTTGFSDIFKVDIYSNGSFSNPKNLGTNINTEGRETFPFVSNENEMYFASDGHPGLGGLDVFVAKINEKGDPISIKNVGEPVNSNQDDFAYYLDSKSRTGYFTSNRPGGHGDDDIYKFTETKKLECEQLLSGYVFDEDTKLGLPNTKVVLLDENDKELTHKNTDEKGYYQFPTPCDAKYHVRASKNLYESNEGKVVIPNIDGSTALDLTLPSRRKNVEVGDDIGPKLGIKMIYFDLDKSFIRPDAAIELEKISVFMKQFPNVKIDARSHTDSRQTFKYNEALSERRAQSTVAWLVANGIDAARLTGKGYGETQLVNKCADGVQCSEEEHQRNRRSEFVIVSLKKE